MLWPPRYRAIADLALLQRQAGVDPAVAELVAAYARLKIDAGEPVTFAFAPFAPETLEARLLARVTRSNPGGDPRFLQFVAAYSAALTVRALPVALTADQLSRCAQTPRRTLEYIARNDARFYRVLSIPKANGGTRQLHAPLPPLADVQRWILRRILDRTAPHAAAHAFVRRRSIVTNAVLHAHKQVVVRLDLEDFFPSIGIAAVRRVFQRIGYPYSVAQLLARLCTLAGRLPQGAPSSPALSNLVNLRLDRRFTALAARLNFTYTRYADDLVLSSNDRRLPALIPFFRDVLRDEGYKLNERKTRIMRRGRAQRVTGLVTNAGIGIGRKRLRLLRAALHRLRTQGAAAVELPGDNQDRDIVRVLEGHLAFARMANPAHAGKLKI